MPNKQADVYEQQWQPQDYLRQYYSTPYITDDEQCHLTFLANGLQRLSRKYRLGVEVGCGPTVHHAMPLIDYVDQIYMTDLLSENLDEVRLWLQDDPRAHQWDAYLSAVLDVEDGRIRESLECRKQAMRQRVTRLFPADLREPMSLGTGEVYDLIVSYYCFENVATCHHDWRSLLKNLCNQLKPGGVMFMGAALHCREYYVLNRSFPCVPLELKDFADALPTLGFPPEQTEIIVKDNISWGAQGIKSICCVRAEKSSLAKHQVVAQKQVAQDFL